MNFGSFDPRGRRWLPAKLCLARVAQLRRSCGPQAPETLGHVSNSEETLILNSAVQPRFPVLRTQAVPTCATRVIFLCGLAIILLSVSAAAADPPAPVHAPPQSDPWSLLFVFALSTFIGLGVILRVSRLLHTPLMSLTNAISAIAIVGAIIVTGSDYPGFIRFLGAVALFASMTNIVSGFLLTDRMLKMFKQPPGGRS